MNIKAQLEKIREIEEQRYNIDPLYYDGPELEPVVEAIRDAREWHEHCQRMDVLREKRQTE